MAEKIKVLIVDDSMSIRLLLRSICQEAADMEVVGEAENPLEARQLIRDKNPDVITLDVEMPHMDGITFLEKIMSLKPTPVVMISTLTQEGSNTAMKALQLGAVDIVAKPSQKSSEVALYAAEITTKIRAASYANVGQANIRKVPSSAALNSIEITPSVSVDDVFPIPKTRHAPKGNIIAIGASTGGPTALREIVSKLQTNLPPIAVVQHMAASFMTAMSKTLNQLSALTIVEATDGLVMQDGHIYTAPGGKHFAVRVNQQGKYVCQILDFNNVNRHKPSVDILFRSVAAYGKSKATAVILTGMGDDGAKCLKEVFDAGGRTFAQSEESCIVYGMPRSAVRLNPQQQTNCLSTIITKISETKTS